MSGWIGIDLDGTLARSIEVAKPSDFDPFQVGEPIEPMCSFVKGLLAEGADVRIMTARVGPHGTHYPDGTPIPVDFNVHSRRVVVEWCRKHLGRSIPVTCEKDYQMIALYDDRAVQIIPNTGQRADGRPL